MQRRGYSGQSHAVRYTTQQATERVAKAAICAASVSPNTSNAKYMPQPNIQLMAGRAQSAQRLAMGGTVWVSNPGGESRFFAPVQTGPVAHPASCTMGTGSFSGGLKRPERGVDHKPYLALRLKKE